MTASTGRRRMGEIAATGSEGIKIIRIGGWRSGRWYVWCYVVFGSILWCGSPPENAGAQDIGRPTPSPPPPIGRLRPEPCCSEPWVSPALARPISRRRNSAFSSPLKGGADFHLYRQRLPDRDRPARRFHRHAAGGFPGQRHDHAHSVRRRRAGRLRHLHHIPQPGRLAAQRRCSTA